MSFWDKINQIINWKVLISSGIVSVITITSVLRYIKSRKLRRKIANFRAEIKVRKENVRKILLKEEDGNLVLVTRERKKILDLELSPLVSNLQTGQVSPVDVLEAYQAKAIEVDDEKNCVCQFISEARNWALELRKIPIDKRGPLYGLPVSVKECFMVKAYPYTAGLSRFMDEKAPGNSPIVEMLQRLGAIPFVLTNVPQTMKSWTCSNPLYGETLNPFDNLRTPGGSTGGDACLQALGGSILGIGTDVGGSLRIPATFCGISGIKSTTGRLPTIGRRIGNIGRMVGIHSNAGLMSPGVSGLVLGMKNLLANPFELAQLDHTVAPIPWDERLFCPKRKLKIGWFEDSGRIEPTPANKKCVRKVVGLLEEAGHSCEFFKPFDVSRLCDFYMTLVLADKGENFLHWLKDDIIDDNLKYTTNMMKIPVFVRPLIRQVLKLVSPITAEAYGNAGHKTWEFQRIIEDIENHTTETLNKWKQFDYDVIVCPAFAFTAPKTEDANALVVALEYTYYANILNLPAGVLPVTLQTSEDMEELKNYPSPDRQHRHDNLYKKIIKTMQGAVNSPVGIQVIGKPFQEEMVLGAMKEIERLVQITKD